MHGITRYECECFRNAVLCGGVQRGGDALCAVDREKVGRRMREGRGVWKCDVRRVAAASVNEGLPSGRVIEPDGRNFVDPIAPPRHAPDDPRRAENSQ